MKNLPIGIQSFSELRENDFLYIDKTEHIFELVSGSKVYFLSRPRRFGKSLLVSTLKELFLANKELFKDLWIEDKIEWVKYPVVHFDFAKADYKQMGLTNYFLSTINKIAVEYDMEINSTTIGFALEELIQKLHKKYNQQVVLLIDEYDKPIIDFLGKDQIDIAVENREIMKEFYSPIKSLDNELRFFFMTGVTKFSKVSIFSDLNHLLDISLSSFSSTLLGYTEKEIIFYFDEYIKETAKTKNIKEIELIEKMRLWYNGYDFRGKIKVYNPFSVLNFFRHQEFNTYWFETGTPTFLVKLVEEGGYYDMKNVKTTLPALGNFEITNLDPIAVLFQTGYLTLKEHIVENVYQLGYPNKEVENSMVELLLAQYTKKQPAQTTNLLLQLKESFDTNDLENVFVDLNALFADIPYQIFDAKREKYYHSVIFLTFKHLGYYATSEVSTSRGRIDAVVETQNSIYILEFKVNDTAQNALKQIKEKKYADKYLNQNKKIILIGVSFEDKAIKEYVVEELK